MLYPKLSLEFPNCSSTTKVVVSQNPNCCLFNLSRSSSFLTGGYLKSPSHRLVLAVKILKVDFQKSSSKFSLAKNHSSSKLHNLFLLILRRYLLQTIHKWYCYLCNQNVQLRRFVYRIISSFVFS